MFLFLGTGASIPIPRNRNTHTPHTWLVHLVNKPGPLCWFCAVWLFSKNIGFYTWYEQNVFSQKVHFVCPKQLDWAWLGCSKPCPARSLHNAHCHLTDTRFGTNLTSFLTSPSPAAIQLSYFIGYWILDLDQRKTALSLLRGGLVWQSHIQNYLV